MIWLTPNVAMNELTLSFTTTNPDKNPTSAQTATAIRALRTPGMTKLRPFGTPAVASLWRNVAMARDNEHIAPTDKSNEFVASGMRNANASSPIGTFSPNVSLKVAALRNVSVFQMPKTIMKPTNK